MNIFKKLIRILKGGKHEVLQSLTNNHEVASNSPEMNTSEEIQHLLKPLIRDATKIEVLPKAQMPENSQLLSHFGGDPYFEKGDKWPQSKSGRHMDFIFQIYNTEDLILPKSIKLIQLFYDLEEFPWDTKDDGWKVKIYESLKTENIQRIERPQDLEESNYCEMIFRPIKSLPDWEGIDLYMKKASDLSCVLNEDEPWDQYDKAVEKLIGKQDYQSQLGGYPQWVQGESTPEGPDGEPMKLLFQIDSEDNAGLMWGDVGLIYVFYDERTKKTEFSLQCH